MEKYDISKLAFKWNMLQKISVGTVFVFFHTFFMLISDLIRARWPLPGGLAVDYDSITFSAIALLPLAFLARRSWSTSASADQEALARLRSTYRVLLWLCIVATIGGIGSGVALDGVNDSIGTKAGAVGALAAVAAIYSLIILWLIRKIRREEVRGLGVPLSDIVEAMQRYELPAPKEAQWHIRIDRPFGLMWFVLGAVLFLVGATAVSVLWDAHSQGKLTGNIAQLQQIGYGIEIMGAWCIFKGRTYFVPSAEAVLAIDTRAPVLYLRSFADDKAVQIESGASGGTIDRSLEMKLSKYFYPFAPFVAIGSPRDRLPKLGAIRLMRSDDEWRKTVSRLMSESRWIVASVGMSDWIKWEISEVVARGFINKTLFLLPVTAPKWLWSNKKRRAQQQERIAILSALLPPGSGVGEESLDKKEFLLGCVLQEGKPVLVVSKDPRPNAQLLAAVTGHFLLKYKRRVDAV